MTHSSNSYLTPSQQKDNAEFILAWLLARGWTKNAVCGMLGNMQTESTINPGIFENLNYGDLVNGFGLVQWTPAQKYISWAESKGYIGYQNYGKLLPQLLRIEYERENNIQWIDGSMSFHEFSRSTDTPYNLAIKFITAYERPADPNQPIRGQQANAWFNLLSGTGEKPAFPTVKDKSYISYPFGWRSDPITGVKSFHRGTDYASNDGSNIPIYATQSGVIKELGYGSVRGNAIVIEHTGDSFTSFYFHMFSMTTGLQVGSSVSKGQQIGLMGTTGYSTGVHLHFGISTVYPESYDTPDGPGSFVDPEVYLEGYYTPGPTPTKKGNIIFWGRPNIY